MRAFLCCSVVALLGFAAPFHPPPTDAAGCSQTEVGNVRRQDSRGLTLSVITGYEEQPRVSVFGWGPKLFGKNVKCAISRREIRFDRTADGSRDLIIGDAPTQTYCEDDAAITIKDLKRVQQICH
jgi:hypothetical protein